jgi:putative membrane protein
MNTVAMKAATFLFWVLAITAWVQGWDGLLGYLPTIGLIVAGIHVLEVLLFWVAFRKKSNNVRLDAIQVFIFGMFHLQRFMPKS